MPYITEKDRALYDKELNQIGIIYTKGDLEYIIFKLMKKYMESRENRYATLHDCVYAVAHASDEFRRRYLDKREDEAMKINGDIT